MNTQQKEPLEGIGKPEPQQPRRQPQTTLSRKEKTDVAKILGFAGALVVLALVGMLIFLRPSNSEVEGTDQIPAVYLGQLLGRFLFFRDHDLVCRYLSGAGRADFHAARAGGVLRHPHDAHRPSWHNNHPGADAGERRGRGRFD